MVENIPNQWLRGLVGRVGTALDVLENRIQLAKMIFFGLINVATQFG